MAKPDPTLTPRIVTCSSDECTPRGTRSLPHPVTAACRMPRTVVEPQMRGEQ